LLGSLASGYQEPKMIEPSPAPAAALPASALATTPDRPPARHASPSRAAVAPSADERRGLEARALAGVWVPVITPFLEDGAVDERALVDHVEGLIAAGVHGVVLAGTTGESPTVRWGEVERLLGALVRSGRGRVPILVGTGTNDTAESVERTGRARALGADGAFVVCPYYNRPSAAGVIAHYRAVAAVGLPTVAYHIPYRTGLTLDLATLQAILSIPGVVGLKESSGGLSNVGPLARGGGGAVLCGEDAIFLEALEAGAHGGILAAANLVPAPFVETYTAFAAGRREQARALFARVVHLVDLLFAEANPGPLKWALHRQGRIPSAAMRLPMVPIGAELAGKLAAALPPTRAEIEDLVARFRAATVPATEWTHRRRARALSRGDLAAQPGARHARDSHPRVPRDDHAWIPHAHRPAPGGGDRGAHARGPGGGGPGQPDRGPGRAAEVLHPRAVALTGGPRRILPPGPARAGPGRPPLTALRPRPRPRMRPRPRPRGDRRARNRGKLAGRVR
jgi:4-hydroxy-tetrahydrodipicolinate synthase